MKASISEVLVALAADADAHAAPGRPCYLSLRTAAILLGVTTSSLELALREEGAPSLLALEAAARGVAWTAPRRVERAWSLLQEAAWERGAHAAALRRYEALRRAEASSPAPASPEPAQASLLAPAPLQGLASADDPVEAWARPVARWREVAAGTFWAFDTETTGLSASEDRIIELALVEFEGGAPTGQRIVRRYNPEGRWSRAAELVHGIPLRELEREPLWRDKAAGLASWLQGRVLVAHNAAFDRRMLEAELRRAGVEVPEVEWVCTREVAKKLHPKASHKLDAMCALKGVPLPNHHRADCDAEACGRLLVALAGEG
jgi:DNA polymerase III epsilon subunit-like protein